MRLGRLDLSRYGRFTDASLAFGPPPCGTPDLHIIYGDNEAGKTTTLHALLDLVFGIETATPYSFLHQAAALRLGGTLELGGEVRDVVRLPKMALLDIDERPLPEGLFSQDLAGLDRASYQMMFSLDEKTLAAGGEAILASRGDLGQLLFSATAGLASFADALAKVRAETETFYKLHGRKHELGDLKRQLADLKERRAAIDVTATPFAKMIAAREDAQGAYEAAVRERGRLQGELATIQRQLSTLPRLTEWARLKADHDRLPAGPSVPPDWPETLAELQKTLVALGARRAAAIEEIERLVVELDALPRDDAGVALAERVRALAALRARDATAARDLPDRRAGLRLAETKVADLVRELGQAKCSEPRQLLLPSSLANRLRLSLEALAGLTTALYEAEAALNDAQHRWTGATAPLDDMDAITEEGPALVLLRTSLAAAETGDSASRCILTERAAARHAEVLAERMLALAPWQGDAEALAVLDVPARHESERLTRELDASRHRVDEWRAEAARLDHEICKTTRVRDGLITARALVDDGDAVASRAARDAAWSAHVERLDRESAAAFEQALRADDLTVKARFAQAAELSELRALNRSLDAATADLQSVQQRLEDARCDGRAIEARIAERFAPFVGAHCDAPLAAFESFLVKRERALDARDHLRNARAEHSTAAVLAAETRRQLSEALAGLGVQLPETPTLAAMIATARATLERGQAVRAQRQRVGDLAREVGERQRQMQRAEHGKTLWQNDWTRMLQSTWLAGADADFVRDALTTLAELGPALEFKDGLADRVAKMEADRAAFATEIGEVASALGLAAVADVSELAERVEARTRTATANAAARAAKVEDQARARDRLIDLQPALEAAETRAKQMTSVFSVATLDDLAVMLDALRRREELGERLRHLDVEICSAGGSTTVEDVLSAFSVLERDTLERRFAELEILCENQMEHTQDCFAAFGRARDLVAAVDGDAAAARLEAERRTLLLEIEDRTMAHLALRAGIIAAENAISLFRDRHRSSMMTYASDLFSHLTRGAYSGLAAQSTKDGEVLVGLSIGGGSKVSTEMSTATRHQLYLALRMAAYREFTKTRQPVPFVLDDVLETFDDDRAAASLSLLADMATTGQVIYLTHHKHLCAIAQRACPTAQFHDLGAI